MSKFIPKIRKKIAKNTTTTATICGILIFVSLFQILTLFRDRIVSKIFGLTHSDLLVRIIYLDRSNDPNLYYALGEYYFGAGAYDFEKSKYYFEKSISIDEKLPLAHYQLSRIYFITGDQKTALSEINKEIEYYPNFKRSHYIRGLVYGYSGKLDLAVLDFKEFIAWKPETWAGYNDLAWIYFQQGDFTNSYETAAKGLKYAPGNPWLLNTVGISLKNLGDSVGAKRAFEASLATINTLTPESWGKAYPGNDPDFYNKGFSNMKKTVEDNIALLNI